MSPVLIAIIVTIFAILTAVTIIWGIRAYRQQVLAGREELIGKIAAVRTVMKPQGTVFSRG